MKNLIDLHCDTISALQKAGNGETLYENRLCVDIKRMERAGTAVQFLACFVQGSAFMDAGDKKAGESAENQRIFGQRDERIPPAAWERAYEAVKGMIARIRQEERENFRLAVSYEEILKNRQEDRISAVATVEEGGALNGKRERLKELYESGIRLLTLTWNYENCLGYPNNKKKEKMCLGLKPFGIEILEQMNRMGMLADVSHLSDGGFWDCIRYSSAPIVASHSNARSLCPHPRNLTDEMLRALAEKGGVAGLNFYPVFLRNEAQKVTVMDIVRHALYMIRVAGEDVVAIGTDFDGFELGTGGQRYISHVGEMPMVWEAMKKAGITERQLDKIWSANALRVMKEVLRTGGQQAGR